MRKFAILALGAALCGCATDGQPINPNWYLAGQQMQLLYMQQQAAQQAEADQFIARRDMYNALTFNRSLWP